MSIFAHSFYFNVYFLAYSAVDVIIVDAGSFLALREETINEPIYETSIIPIHRTGAHHWKPNGIANPALATRLIVNAIEPQIKAVANVHMNTLITETVPRTNPIIETLL